MSGLPTPREVNARFSELLSASSEKATDYLYDLGLNHNYIKTEAIKKNICWTSKSPYGELKCTINLSKPEKDPRVIADEAKQKSALPTSPDNIPQCDLCWENEDFPGTPEHPAKPGLRIAAINLDGEKWGLQYSPYAYFHKHCIVLSEKHRPMKIDENCFRRLVDFVDMFPHFFIGANADLPIVGGSILSHDHFQGGDHAFPLMRAPIEREVFMSSMPPGVVCGIVRWPSSVLRMVSENRAAIVQASATILKAWQNYSNPECHILAFSPTDKCTLHNTLNPILRKVGSTYIMDLVLRNNRTDTEHPWGIFHPNESLHHIKKENIGLIEIMGLAILPPRLATELPLVQSEICAAATEGLTANQLKERLLEQKTTAIHARWAAEILSQMKDKTDSQLLRSQTYLQQEVAGVFVNVLEATGVFKRNNAGKKGWESFINLLNT